jgi:hypothetical protein
MSQNGKDVKDVKDVGDRKKWVCNCHNISYMLDEWIEVK